MRGLAALAVVCAIGLSGPAMAEAGTDPLHVPYRALLAGMEIGTSALSIEVIGHHYRLGIDGLMIAPGSTPGVRARAHVAGSIVRSGLAPDHYSAMLEQRNGKTRVALGFANGTLAMVAVLPPPSGGSGRTRPATAQSRGLTDPLSALVMPAAPANLAPLSACGRTQRVFDGSRRFDITLFPSRIETVEIAGQRLSALVCRAELRTAATASRRPERWPEVAPRGQQAVVWLAPIAGERLLAPVRIEAGMRLGTLTVEATDVSAFDKNVRAAALR